MTTFIKGQPHNRSKIYVPRDVFVPFTLLNSTYTYIYTHNAYIRIYIIHHLSEELTYKYIGLWTVNYIYIYIYI